MPTNEELQNQIDELKVALSTMGRKLREVEDYTETHTGLDWGTAGIHSPHPNLSSDTIESGGGVVRQNSLGTQIKITDTGDPTSVAFVKQFATTDTTDTSETLGHITERGDLVGNSPRTQKTALLPSATHFIREEWFTGTSTSHVKWELFDGAGSVILAAMSIQVDSLGVPLVRIGATPLLLDGLTVDPDASDLYDGMIWYRSDTDKHRVRQNGVTHNLITEGGLVAGGGTTLTIAAGVVTATTGYHLIDTESAGASDDLDTVNGGVTGQIYVFRAANDARSVVFKDATGNLQLEGDFTADNSQDTLTCIYTGTAFLELARSNNGA
jgi:hypothetical protein